jgi:hypothetical protein
MKEKIMIPQNLIDEGRILNPGKVAAPFADS